MSFTLYAMKTPQTHCDEIAASCSLKGIFSMRFYDHDGSLNGSLISLTRDELEWIRGVKAAFSAGKADQYFLNFLINEIEENGSVDIKID